MDWRSIWRNSLSDDQRPIGGIHCCIMGVSFSAEFFFAAAALISFGTVVMCSLSLVRRQGKACLPGCGWCCVRARPRQGGGAWVQGRHFTAFGGRGGVLRADVKKPRWWGAASGIQVWQCVVDGIPRCRRISRRPVSRPRSFPGRMRIRVTQAAHPRRAVCVQ